MADSSDEQAARGEVERGLSVIEAAFVIADEATISDQPAEASSEKLIEKPIKGQARGIGRNP
jgi:hypothetical protein